MSLVVSGAYGREYTSVKAIKADWESGKDFIIRTFGPDDGRYINKADAEKAGIQVQVRYANDLKITGLLS